MPHHPIPVLLFCLAFCSCKKEEIRTYRVVSEPERPAEEVPAHGRESHDHAAHSHPVTWRASPNWKQEEPGQFLTAAYAVPGVGRVTVSKLGGDGGGLAANVNRWRGQAGLEALPEAEVRGQPMPVTDSNREMLLFNLNPDDAAPDAEGIFAAVLPLDSETWYFKFTGASAKLRENGGEFMDFLGSVRVPGASPAPPPAAAAPAMPKINVTAPDSWDPSQGSSMRAASFTVSGADGASADVSVIPLPGNPGSVFENVNLWRNQLQLPPLASPDDPALGTKLEGAAGTYFLSHMTSEAPLLDGNAKAAISGAILETPGKHTWFFKIIGDASLVEANREKFESFVRTATFP